MSSPNLILKPRPFWRRGFFMPSFFPRPLWGPGGLGGTLVADMATRYLANAGAALAAVTALGVGLFLAADRLVVRVLRFSAGLLTYLGERSIKLLHYTLLRGALSDSSTEKAAELEWWQRRRTSTLNAEDSEKEDDGIAIKVRGRKPKIEDAVEEEYEEELEEINEKTDLDVRYKELKTGQKITSIEFSISRKQQSEEQLIQEILSTQTKSDFIPANASKCVIDVLLDDELELTKNDI